MNNQQNNSQHNSNAGEPGKQSNPPQPEITPQQPGKDKPEVQQPAKELPDKGRPDEVDMPSKKPNIIEPKSTQ